MSAPIGERISVTGISQSGSTIATNGTGFSTEMAINFFNNWQNFGGFNGASAPNIPLTFLRSHQFTFKVPAGTLSGAAFVQALNPPFIAFTAGARSRRLIKGTLLKGTLLGVPPREPLGLASGAPGIAGATSLQRRAARRPAAFAQ